MSSRRCEGEIRAAARLSAEIVLSIATELESRAEGWRPYRSTALMQLWAEYLDR